MHSPLKVLVVEDPRGDASAVLEELGHGDYILELRQVRTLPRFREAVQSERWDLAICEEPLRDFDVFDALELAREKGPDVPLLVLSRDMDERKAAKLMRAGARDCLSKDDLARLLPVVERELEAASMRRDNRRAREALERLSSRYLLILNAAGEGILGLDEQGEIAFANPAAARITGWEIGELLGQPMHDLLCHEGSEAVSPWSCKVHRALVDGRVHRGNGETFHKKNGETFFCDCVSTPIVENEEILGAVVVFKDISERMRAQREKEELERHLRQAQKMEAIGTLAGGIAHDFNNILAIILGYAELARDSLAPDRKERKFLDEVRQAAIRAKGLIHQILTFSRRSKDDRKLVHLDPLVKETLKMLRATLPSTIEIREDVDSHKPVLADPAQMHQVIMNLCTNAYQAMRENGGVLAVSVGDEDAGDPDSPTEAGNGRVQLEVLDTGCGMEPAIQGKIFDPYFTTKEPGEGTGLGLAVVRGIVDNHGGAIEVSSRPGQGTRIRIRFPAAPDSGDLRELREAAWETLPGGSERLLFVEDDESLTALGRTTLEALGYRVTCRKNGLEALEVFRAAPTFFDLLITDMNMPFMTGADLCQEVLKIRPDLPVVLCTGFTELIDGEKAQALGARKYLTKPVPRHKLAEAIREALDGVELKGG